MSRLCTSLAVGSVLLAAACAAPQSVANRSPNAKISPQASPTPSPSPAPLAITGAPFHGGELGLGYAPVSPTAKGGVPPYSWEIADGALPAGLVMSTAGKVTGTPTILGTYLFTIRVSDAAGSTSIIQSTISVARRLVVTGNPCTPVSLCNVEAGCMTVCGVFGFVTGGFPPYRYKVISGALPTGMGLSGFALTKAFPAPPAGSSGKDWTFRVRATDAIGATAETTAKFHVFPHIAFKAPLTASCAGAWGGTPCSLSPQLAYTGGTPGLTDPTVKVISGPKGLTFTVQGGFITQISTTCSVTPKPPTYTGPVKITIQDKSTCGANQYCTSGSATINLYLRGCP